MRELKRIEERIVVSSHPPYPINDVLTKGRGEERKRGREEERKRGRSQRGDEVMSVFLSSPGRRCDVV